MLNSKHFLSKRKNIFYLSLLCLLIAVAIIYRLVWYPSPSLLIDDKEEPALAVEISTFKSESHPINYQAFGTAEAEKSRSIKATLAGQVHFSIDLYPGKELLAGTQIFSIDKCKVDRDITLLNGDIRQNELQTNKLEKDRDLLRLKIETAKVLLKITEDTLETQRNNHLIEERLFSNTKKLYLAKTISESDFLKKQRENNQSELAVLQAEAATENNRANVYQLTSSLENTEYQLEGLVVGLAGLASRKQELERERAKSDVTVQEAVKIVKVLVNRDEEVSPGTPLVELRELDAINLPVAIPDHYFKWLYQGPLLKEETHEKLTIYLVNEHFHKSFNNAYIKSIGEKVNTPTRSLPVIISRDNPQNSDGNIIPDEEILPGMFCKVTFKLCEVPNTFLIPQTALQKDQRLLQVTAEENSDEMMVTILTDFEILHRSADGLLIHFPNATYSELTLITEELSQINSDMKVKGIEAGK